MNMVYGNDFGVRRKRRRVDYRLDFGFELGESAFSLLHFVRKRHVETSCYAEEKQD